MGNHDPKLVRTCDTTGLPVCFHAQRYIKLNAVCAVVFLLVGVVAALLLGLTRWQAVHLLGPEWYYRLLTAHGLNMLIFWIIFMEIAILYFAATSLLKTRLASSKLAALSFLLMIVGALMGEYSIFITKKSDVLLTSYIPLKAHPSFYLGLILFAVGALVGVINFFATIYIARRDRTYEGSVPLVVFGAIAAAIIAVLTLLHGAVALVPTFFWSMGWTGQPDPVWYRLVWWALGHSSQQINVCAMVSVWYLLATLTTGAKPLNEAVCRSAFVLYILFISIAAAHHLLVDPGVGAGWKIWNTSYAMYLAVLASLIHGFTVPASVEVAMRHKGYVRGMFGWLGRAPWRNPGFSAFFLSLLIFGFIGGITGVTLGTQQINITAHNTLRIPGHFHATVAGGTSLAFMGLTYYVVPLIFRREYRFKKLVRIQPYLFAGGITLLALSMSFAGSYGVPRRHADVDFTNAQLSAGFDAGAYAMLALVGIAAILAFTAVLIYILTTVVAVFTGPRIIDRPMESWGEPTAIVTEKLAKDDHRAPGTMVLALTLLVAFAVYYFANWKALADVWPVR